MRNKVFQVNSNDEKINVAPSILASTGEDFPFSHTGKPRERAARHQTFLFRSTYFPPRQLLLFLNVRAIAPAPVTQEAAEAQALLAWKA
ncbi:hypothetical protein CKAN_02699100 [Cinnamomum micranthum f. kanehirae]|uniref:Uncharacterized protein n=1 Tax=Cinnamomum micranthum f. kanehirae TaxID=337451 RepID=A0A443Q3I8_9MAGN|nr:hypothetical protein CKAN_02699100 [Cinnamomum micranthum f. kanehirae]